MHSIDANLHRWHWTSFVFTRNCLTEWTICTVTTPTEFNSKISGCFAKSIENQNIQWHMFIHYSSDFNCISNKCCYLPIWASRNLQWCGALTCRRQFFIWSFSNYSISRFVEFDCTCAFANNGYQLKFLSTICTAMVSVQIIHSGMSL